MSYVLETTKRQGLSDSTEGTPEPKGGGVWPPGRAWLGESITPYQRPSARESVVQQPAGVL